MTVCRNCRPFVDPQPSSAVVAWPRILAAEGPFEVRVEVRGRIRQNRATPLVRDLPLERYSSKQHRRALNLFLHAACVFIMPGGYRH